MASRNPDSAANQQGEFHASRPRDEPLTTHGHKPGKIVSEADARPEFSAQVLPAGSAPASRTFKPNPTDETPYDGHSASDTLGGATSADVHTGYGHPGQGQTSTEIRHDGQHTGTKQGLGLAGLAGNVRNDLGDVTGRADQISQRGLYDDRSAQNAGQRGNVGGPPAQDREPVGAGELTSERK